MIILPGNNAIQYCQTALMKIVEDHLNSNTTRDYKDDGFRIRVTEIQKSDQVFIVSVTTDKEEK